MHVCVLYHKVINRFRLKIHLLMKDIFLVFTFVSTPSYVSVTSARELVAWQSGVQATRSSRIGGDVSFVRLCKSRDKGRLQKELCSD